MASPPRRAYPLRASEREKEGGPWKLTTHTQFARPHSTRRSPQTPTSKALGDNPVLGRQFQATGLSRRLPDPRAHCVQRAPFHFLHPHQRHGSLRPLTPQSSFRKVDRVQSIRRQRGGCQHRHAAEAQGGTRTRAPPGRCGRSRRPGPRGTRFRLTPTPPRCLEPRRGHERSGCPPFGASPQPNSATGPHRLLGALHVAGPPPPTWPRPGRIPVPRAPAASLGPPASGRPHPARGSPLTAVEPFFTASCAYSTWKRWPSGEKTVMARS